MTLSVGDHLIIKREGKIVEDESYHEFEVISVTYLGRESLPTTDASLLLGKTLYQAVLKVIE